LRRRHPPARYLGIELELNQSFALGGGKPWRDLRACVVAALRAALRGRLHDVPFGGSAK